MFKPRRLGARCGSSYRAPPEKKDLNGLDGGHVEQLCRPNRRARRNFPLGTKKRRRPRNPPKPPSQSPIIKSFLLLFFKKEVLFFFEEKSQKTFGDLA